MEPLLTPPARQILLRNRLGTNGDAGAVWVEGLPGVVATLLEIWGLTPEPSSYPVSYNYVTAVRRADGTRAVLKVCYPDNDFRREETAIRAFGGRGSARLIESDIERSALLLEALEPGRPVSSLGNDIAEVSATVTVIKALNRTPPEGIRLPTFEDFIDGIARRAAEFASQYAWIEHGIELGRELVSNPAGPAVILHGDLHHDNVLSSGGGWRSVDPHGVLGEQAWETGPYFFNNLQDSKDEATWRLTIRRRADQLAEELGLDRQRIYACGAAYAVISSAWSLEEGRTERSLAKRRAVMQELGGF